MPDDFNQLDAESFKFPFEEGDSIETLADAFEVSAETVKHYNPQIQQTRPGENIRLPFPRCESGNIYIVRRGDTLPSIARRFNTTVVAIIRANPFIGILGLRPGFPICIPVPRPGRCPGGFFYTVMAGDTLFSIANRFNTSVQAILQANPGLDPNRLFIGEQICIPSPQPVPCPGGFIYTIVAGDTLFSIANRFNTSVQAILQANPGLDPNRLFIGQQICIPARRPMPCSGFFYTVVAGDTLNSIAARFNTSVDAILRANPGLNPNFIVIGQQICIPR